MRSTIFAGLVVSIGAAAASASIITLNTGLLPTQQPGWAYDASGVHANLAESTLFSTNGTVLTSNSMGQAISGSAGSARARYDIGAAIPVNATVEMNARMRVVASQVLQFNYGFHMGVAGSGKRLMFGFSTTTISDQNQSNTAFNTTGWHDYRMVGDWAAGTYQLFIDGSLVRTGNLANSANDWIEIGDGTGTANAHVEIESFSVTIPSPSSLALLGAGGLFAARRRR